MAAITAPLVLIWRRAKANWRFHLVLLAGMLLATTLLAGAPLYLHAMSELGLRHALEFERTGVVDTAILVPSRPLDESGYAQTAQRVQAQVDKTIGPIVAEQVSFIKTPGLDVRLTAETRPGSVKASIMAYAGYEARTRLIEGAFPQARGGADGRIEAGIGRETARIFGLRLGDTVEVTPIGGTPTRVLRVTIAGVMAANDVSERYWSFSIDPFAPQTDFSTGAEIPLAPLLVSQEIFLRDITASFRGIVADYWWYEYVEGSRIKARDVTELRASVTALEKNLPADLPGTVVLSGLGGTLDDFHDKLFFSRIPVLIMVVLVVAIVLYYLVLVASAVVERHLAEIALFRSRGANAAQVMTLYLWEAFFLAVAAVIAGPLLARLLVPLLGYAPAFSDVTDGASLPVEMSASVVWFALLGAGLSLLALALPALQGARFNVLDARAAVTRPALTLFLHRYFIDFFLFALAGILYWELTQRGSLVTTKLFGRESVDELLLAAPVLFMVSVALLMLRFLPLLLRVAGLLAPATNRVWLAMGLWDLGRNPIHYLRPALLLMLVAGMAMFAASYNDTLERSFRDRGLFTAGSDLRLQGLPSFEQAPKEIMTARFEQLPAVKAASPVFRISPREDAFSSGARGGDLLAVDSLKFHRVAFFREDFSENDLFELLRLLDRGRSMVRGRDLPADVTALGVWVRPAQSRPSVSLWARVRDGAGRDWRYRLGRMDFEDWRFLQADLQGLSGAPLPEPVTVQSLYFWELDFPTEPAPLDQVQMGFTSTGRYNLSGLTAFSISNPRGVPVDALEQPGGWAPMATSLLFPETIKSDAEVQLRGRPTLQFAWSASPGTGTRGFFPSDTAEPLPVVASQRFLASTGRRVGDAVDIQVAGIPMPVKIAGAVEFFPTMDPYRPFVLGNVDTLLHYANLFRGLSPTRPNEVWLALDDDKDARVALLNELRTSGLSSYITGDSQALLTQLVGDPLVGTGSRGIVFAVLVVLVIVSLVGYLGYYYVSSHRTPLEFSVLRALGLSGRQLLAFQALVHGVIGIGAVLLGAWIGMWTHRIVIAFLEHTEEGSAVLPPFAPQTDWSGVGLVLIVAAAAMAVVVGWLGWRFVKAPVWQALRRGDN